ncbi:hypothetical protein [Sphingobacterium multivorum]|uniref:hypothetical protein n=1 Tax=Sphingobacterium multivorum TaxID=28454 RepID=UPI0028A9D3F0|nr:hypothetical protein [Sphingobacterium multivorum]
MAFLTKEELKTAIRTEKLSRISDEDDMIIAKYINAAITEVKSRLTPNNKKAWLDGRLRYDVDAIFNATGEDRHELLLDITKVVALWRLIIRNNAGVDYAVIESRYQFSIEYLKDLATGEANDSTLPTIKESTNPDGTLAGTTLPFRSGSRKKFNHE